MDRAKQILRFSIVGSIALALSVAFTRLTLVIVGLGLEGMLPRYERTDRRSLPWLRPSLYWYWGTDPIGVWSS